jgi:polyribonucleotide nucleotidyltransferase
MEVALEKAHDARMHILNQMNTVLKKSRVELNKNAPSMKTLKIEQSKIRDIIGKGGATIRALCEETGASIDIEDNGDVRIYAENKAAVDLATDKILSITAEAKIGATYKGTVVRIVDFGAFINVMPGKDGLVHISQIANERVEKVTDYLKEGQSVEVKVLDVDIRGRIKLTMKDCQS